MRIRQQVCGPRTPLLDRFSFCILPTGISRDSSPNEDFRLDTYIDQLPNPVMHWAWRTIQSILDVLGQSYLATLVRFTDVSKRAIPWVQEAVD